MSIYIRNNTEKNAIFLTPPNFGTLRIIGERAIIVDFKAFPFLDEAMLEWKQRIIDCYGASKASGFDAMLEFDQNYKEITDSKMLYLSKKYDASYSVLYNTTIQYK